MYNITVRIISINSVGDNMTNEKKCCKQIETQLNCKATASLDNQIEAELECEDGSLAELLGEDDAEEQEQN